MRVDRPRVNQFTQGEVVCLCSVARENPGETASIIPGQSQIHSPCLLIQRAVLPNLQTSLLSRCCVFQVRILDLLTDYRYNWNHPQYDYPFDWQLGNSVKRAV